MLSMHSQMLSTTTARRRHCPATRDRERAQSAFGYISRHITARRSRKHISICSSIIRNLLLCVIVSQFKTMSGKKSKGPKGPSASAADLQSDEGMQAVVLCDAFGQGMQPLTLDTPLVSYSLWWLLNA